MATLVTASTTYPPWMSWTTTATAATLPPPSSSPPQASTTPPPRAPTTTTTNSAEMSAKSRGRRGRAPATWDRPTWHRCRRQARGFRARATATPAAASPPQSPAAVAVRALYRSMSAAVGPAGGAAAGAAGATIGSGGEEPSAGSAAAGGADGTSPAGMTIASGREPPSEGMGGNPAVVRWEEEGARQSETGMGEDGAEGKVSSNGHCCGRWEQRGLWTTVQRAPQGLASQQGCLIDTPDGQEPGQ